MVTTLKQARDVVKITNRNTKMPGSVYSQDSFACGVGSRLANVKGSVCESCYARKIQKLRPSVNQGWKANLEKSRVWLEKNPTQWVKAVVIQILKHLENSGEPFHRWFDSGDLDSVEQLQAIVQVCESTPNIRHWLPTREIGLVSQWSRQGGVTPDNLALRVSAPMVNDRPLAWPVTSTVHTKDSPVYGHACPAPSQGNSCGDCRACWDSSVPNVSYKKH